MNSSKSKDSTSPSHLSDNSVYGVHENTLAKKITPTYDSTGFSAPSVDQFNGVLPDFNNRLSPERNLGLSPAGHLRLSPETHPRLISGSCVGISSSKSQEILPQKHELPVGKGLEIKPDLAGKAIAGRSIAGRSIAGVDSCSFVSADLPIAPLGSRLVNLVADEEKLKSAEKKN